MRKKDDLLQVGLLILRIGIGISIFFHGLPKIMGGPETWTAIGGTMSNLGINFAPTFWGFMAAFAETVGGILFALGLFFRPAALLLIGTMIVALVMHLSQGDDFMKYGHSLDLLIVFVAALLTGPGKYSFDAKFIPKIA
ncbi:DoxX family protein [Petrimonas sp.]|uniref:DoxX family protein n=1 Tax=Petrimonas sp. TaxID=2023866 RepID=UPI003F518909